MKEIKKNPAAGGTRTNRSGDNIATETTLVKSEFVAPAMRPEEMVAAWKEYESLRGKLEQPGDFVSFKDRDGNTKKAPTKQWRTKLERFFGLSVEIIQAVEEKMESGERLYKVRARAVHPKTGLFHEATGLCSTAEKIDKPNKFHNAASHAETRAKNRAVLEFVGFGEVSAEEIGGDEETQTKRPPVSSKEIPSGAWENDPASDNQRKMIMSLAANRGYAPEIIKEGLKKLYLLESFNDLTKKQASQIIDNYVRAFKAADKAMNFDRVPEEKTEDEKALEEEPMPEWMEQ